MKNASIDDRRDDDRGDPRSAMRAITRAMPTTPVPFDIIVHRGRPDGGRSGFPGDSDLRPARPARRPPARARDSGIGNRGVDRNAIRGCSRY